MQFQILTSDHGNHLPEKWAIATASQIFPVEDASFTGDRLIQAHRLQLAVIELLAGHHSWHQSNEVEKLKGDPAHINNKLTSDCELVTSGVVSLMQGSPWQDHFNDPVVQDAVREVIRSHTITNRHVERSWHADRNPQCEHARKWKGMQ
jgi:hypothetical protein